LEDLPSSLAERAALPSSVPEEVVRHLSSWLASSQLRRLPETEVHRLRSSLVETAAHRLPSFPEAEVRRLRSSLVETAARRLPSFPEAEVRRLRSSLAETVARRLLSSHQLPLNWSLLHVNNRHANIS
jgi:hypothetical protein